MNIQFQKEGNRWIADFQVTADFNLHLEREGTGSLRVMQSTMSGGKYDHIRGGSFNHDDLVVDVDFTSIVYPKFIRVISRSEPTLAEVTCPEGEVTVVEKTISFSIAGTQYTAKPGMTWEQWIESDYNTDGYQYGYNTIGGGGPDEFYYPEEGVISPAGSNAWTPDAVYIPGEKLAESIYNEIQDGMAYAIYGNTNGMG